MSGRLGRVVTGRPLVLPTLLAALAVVLTPAATAARPVAKTATKPAAKPGTKASARGPVKLYHVNRKETLRLRLVDDKGRPVKSAQKRLDRFLRCHYTNQQHRMHPRLGRLLYQVGRHFRGRRLEIVSGYRHPRVAKNPRSPHMKGLACDFRVAGVKNAKLRDYLRRSFKGVGVGYYPNSSFIHLDVRSGKSAFWIDYSGPGERPMYSETPGHDLESGRAESFRPSKIDESWVEEEASADEGDTKPGPRPESRSESR